MAGIYDYGNGDGRMGSQGILGSVAPQQGGTNWGGIFAAIQDAAGHLGGGGRTDNFANFQATNQQNQIRQQLLQGLSATDPDSQRQALMAYAAAGGDASSVLSAMSFGKPKVEHYSEGENVFELDPITGERKQIQTGKRPAPMGYDYGTDGKSLVPLPGGPSDPHNPANMKPPSGYRWDPKGPVGTKLQLIPGFMGGAADLAAARRAPPKAAAVKPTIAIPHPGSMY